ncbi:MAG: hypothetical protein AABZ64_13735, partial [Nitrospinota bacterium]
MAQDPREIHAAGAEEQAASADPAPEAAAFRLDEGGRAEGKEWNGGAQFDPEPGAAPPPPAQGDDAETIDRIESQEWMESLEYVLKTRGPGRVKELLHELQIYAHRHGVVFPFSANTPYINTITREKQPPFPGDRQRERRIKSLVRWNAMAM